MSLPKNPSLSEQLEQHDINRQIAKEMRESEKALLEEILSLKEVNAGLLEALKEAGGYIRLAYVVGFPDVSSEIAANRRARILAQMDAVIALAECVPTVRHITTGRLSKSGTTANTDMAKVTNRPPAKEKP